MTKKKKLDFREMFGLDRFHRITPAGVHHRMCIVYAAGSRLEKGHRMVLIGSGVGRFMKTRPESFNDFKRFVQADCSSDPVICHEIPVGDGGGDIWVAVRAHEEMMKP